MSNLGPQQQNQTYDGLLQVPGGVTVQLQTVQDGDGNNTALKVGSQTVQVGDVVSNAILQIPGGITTTLQTVLDGDGNPTGLQLSSSGANVTTSDTFVASIDGTQIPGVVPRLISDGFGDYLSVKDFGATGDGVTDDTTAIQDAINYIGTITQGRPSLYMPAGVYIVTSPIDIQLSGLVIAGAGQSSPYNSQTSSQYAGGTFIKYTGSALDSATSGVFKFGSLVGSGTLARNVILQDMTIVCQDLANAIWAARANSCSFIRVTTDQAIWGARFYDSNNNSNLFESCEFYDPPTAGGGLDLRTSCHSTTVSDCRFNNKTTGSRNPLTAIVIATDANCSAVTVQNCNFDFYRVTDTHVRLYQDCKAFNFTGNYIEGRGDGITANLLVLAGGSGINVSGNRFSKSNSPTTTLIDYGIQCFATCESVSITGNYFSGFDTAGIRVASGCTGVFAAGNYITGTPTTVNDQNIPDNSVVFDNDAGYSVGHVCSGSYTPTLANVTNITSSIAHTCFYMRVGNTINVSGSVGIQPTAASSIVLEVSLPISTTFTSGYEAGGVATNLSNDVVRIYSKNGDSVVNFVGQVADLTLRDYSFTFSYSLV